MFDEEQEGCLGLRDSRDSFLTAVINRMFVW